MFEVQTHTVRNARLHSYADIDTIYTWKSVRKLYQTLLELSENAWKSAKDYLAHLEFCLKTLGNLSKTTWKSTEITPRNLLEICQTHLEI